MTTRTIRVLVYATNSPLTMGAAPLAGYQCECCGMTTYTEAFLEPHSIKHTEGCALAGIAPNVRVNIP